MLKLGSIQQKILLLLMTGVALGLSHTPRQRYRAVRGLDRGLAEISYNTLRKSIQQLYKNKLISLEKQLDGSLKMLLRERGKIRALQYKIAEMKISRPKYWDKLWRIVMFDLPKSKKQIRDILRLHLKRLGFIQYQKSVFIHPYPCENEIEFIIEIYGIRRFVRQLLVSKIDNDLDLREKFF